MAHTSRHRRLELLNAAQPNRPWHSISERRQCIACEREFHGIEVPIGRDERLACPGCGRAPSLWVRGGNPLLDNVAWSDWQEAMSILMEESGNDALPVG